MRRACCLNNSEEQGDGFLTRSVAELAYPLPIGHLRAVLKAVAAAGPGAWAGPRRMSFIRRSGMQVEPAGEAAYTVRCDAAGQLSAALTYQGRIQHLGVEEMPWRWGGVRYWWVCPGCARRSGVLFRPAGQHHWRCRVCHHVTYASSNQSRSTYERAMNRLFRRSQW
jgi:YD repeat-containing protein